MEKLTIETKYSLLCLTPQKEIKNLIFLFFSKTFEISNNHSMHDYETWLDVLENDLINLKKTNPTEDFSDFLNELKEQLNIDKFLIDKKRFDKVCVFMWNNKKWFKEYLKNKRIEKIRNKINDILKTIEENKKLIIFWLFFPKTFEIFDNYLKYNYKTWLNTLYGELKNFKKTELTMDFWNFLKELEKQLKIDITDKKGFNEMLVFRKMNKKWPNMNLNNEIIKRIRNKINIILETIEKIRN